jgi:hypothetical protein
VGVSWGAECGSCFQALGDLLKLLGEIVFGCESARMMVKIPGCSLKIEMCDK